MAIAVISAAWLIISAGLAFGISKTIAIADRIELGEDHGR